MLDNTVTEQEIFSEHYNELKDILFTRISSKDIPIEKLLPLKKDMFLIDYKTEDLIDFKNNFQKIYSISNTILSQKEMEILRLYFGIGIDKPLTLEKIGQKFNLTGGRIRELKERALRKLKTNSKIRKFKENNEIYTYRKPENEMSLR